MVYFLVMMASMTATGIIYIVNTALTGLEEGLIAGTAIMTAGVIGISGMHTITPAKSRYR